MTVTISNSFIAQATSIRLRAVHSSPTRVGAHRSKIVTTADRPAHAPSGANPNGSASRRQSSPAGPGMPKVYARRSSGARGSLVARRAPTDDQALAVEHHRGAPAG